MAHNPAGPQQCLGGWYFANPSLINVVMLGGVARGGEWSIPNPSGGPPLTGGRVNNIAVTYPRVPPSALQVATAYMDGWAIKAVRVKVTVSTPGTLDPSSGTCVGRTYQVSQPAFFQPAPPIVARPAPTLPPSLNSFLSTLKRQISVGQVGTMPQPGHTFVSIPTCAYVTPAPPNQSYIATMDQLEPSGTPSVNEVVRFTLTIAPQSILYTWGDGSPATPGDAGQPGVHPTQYYGNGQWSSECGPDAHVYHQVYGPDVPGRPSVTVSASQDFVVTGIWSVSDGYTVTSGAIPGIATLHLEYNPAPPLCVFQIQGVPYTAASSAATPISGPNASPC